MLSPTKVLPNFLKSILLVFATAISFSALAEHHGDAVKAVEVEADAAVADVTESLPTATTDAKKSALEVIEEAESDEAMTDKESMEKSVSTAAE